MNMIKSEKNVKSDSIFGLVRRKIGAWLGRAAKESAEPVATVSCPDAGRTKRPETFRRDVPVNRKPTYRPVARGTTFLVDTANLIGAIGPEQAASRLGNLEKMMTACGHSVVFFWEHAAYTWTKAQQATEAEKLALKAFVARENVSLVTGESDLAILQAVQVTPNSICLTRDRLNDYAETYPKIVGSLRHRSFSVARVAGMVTLSVFGLKDAIVLSKPTPKNKPAPVCVAAQKPKTSVMMTSKTAAPVLSNVLPAEDKAPSRHFAPARRAGLYGCVDARLAAGDAEKALELLAQIARTEPTAYDEMSRIYREGDGLAADARAAKRFARLAKEDAKAARQQARRQKRKVANCASGLDYASIRGVKELFLAHDLEECARRRAEGRKLCRRAAHKWKGHTLKFVRFAA